MHLKTLNYSLEQTYLWGYAHTTLVYLNMVLSVTTWHCNSQYPLFSHIVES